MFKINCLPGEKFCGQFGGDICPQSIILQDDQKTFGLFDHIERDMNWDWALSFGGINYDLECTPKLYWNGPIHEAMDICRNESSCKYTGSGYDAEPFQSKHEANTYGVKEFCPSWRM